TVLLLRPLAKDKEAGRQDPLPRVAFVLLGGWLAWWLLPPAVPAALADWVGAEGGGLASLLVSLAPCLLVEAAAWGLSRPLNSLLGVVFRQFNAAFNAATGYSARLVGLLLRVSALVLVAYGGLLLLTHWGLRHLPTGFIPSQDMGYLQVN